MATIQDVYEITRMDVKRYFLSYNGGATEIDLKNPLILSGMGAFKVNRICFSGENGEICEIEPVLVPTK